MNLGHSCETSREIFAYPYPGRSAKISSGRGLPGRRISKKLMLRVRPGVELVRASFVPTRALMTLDLPTLERPKKAISGSDGGGKCRSSVAASRKRDNTRIEEKWNPVEVPTVTMFSSRARWLQVAPVTLSGYKSARGEVR